jgi:hypothetical protein
MANTLRIKRRVSGNAGAPAALANAELAYNEVDDILYYGKGDNSGLATSVVAIAGDGRYAPKASPVFTGDPQAPTPTPGDNDTSIATTAFVNAEITADRPWEATPTNIKINGTQAVGTLDTVARGDHVHPTDTSRAPLASPTFTGTPAAPTAAVTTSTTQVATTAFVNAEIANDAAPIAHVGATGAAHGNATGSVAGFLTAADFTKLSGIAAGATANTGTVTSVALALPAEFTVSGSPVTTTGTLTATKASQTANYVYAAPNGAAGAPVFRALVAADVPTLNQNTTGTAANVTGTVAIANGGTGATAAATALSNLGGAPLASPTFTGTPAAPTAAAGTNTTQVATTAFVAAAVDAARVGLDVKASVRVATTAAGTLATAFANGQVVDGITLATNDRILIKDQAAGAENGIYTVNVAGAPTRATDFDAAGEVTPGAFTFVESGTVNADSGWVLTTDGAITLGTTALSFAQFSGAGAVTAGAGLTKTGATLDVVTASAARILVNADSIDLATVTQTDTAGTDGINFVQSVTKDSYGRVSGRVVADVRAGTTAQTGIVQLTDSTSSTSTTTAATPNAVKTAYDLANGKQAGDATLTALAGVTTAADTLIYATAADTFTTTPLTATARTLLDDATVADMQATLLIGSMTFDGGTF